MSERKPIQSYQELDVWQRGMTLAEQAYKLTRTFPREEQFGMTSQIRRAAVSVPANIAEGWGRRQSRPFQWFLKVALGSLREVETHLLLCERVELCSKADVQPLLDNCTILGKQIVALLRSLEQRANGA